MHPFTRQVFLNEIKKQCEFALRALELLREALAKRDVAGVWFFAQAFLGASGNVSKILWPSPEYSERGKELRQTLNVPDDSPVAPRTFRNHFEHFDERLEKWAVDSKRRNFVDSNILPPGAIRGIDREDFLRNLDPGTLTLTFRGDSYDLGTVEAALRGIYEATRLL
jgi:hypothetical protein